MENKKKVLFFLWSFSLGGGAEKILSTIVSNLDSEKYQIDILEMEHFDKGYEAVPKGVNILKPYKKKSYGRVLDSILWRLRIYFPTLVRNWLIKDEYDIEVSFTIMNPAFPFSKRKEVKKIAWIHGSIEAFLKEEQAHYRNNHFEQLSHVDKIIAISKKTRESIETVYPMFQNKIQTIYNGYDFSTLFEKSAEIAPVTLEKNSICVIGRLEELKGTDRVLEVFKELQTDINDVHLYYIGSGEQENFLKEEVERLQLQDKVHFLGYQKNPYSILKQAKLLLSLSKQEGFSGAVVEAVTLGIPFVSTNVGGALELSNDGQFGEVIETNQEAIDSLKKYITGERKISENYSEFIQQFTIEKQLQQIEELFQSSKEERS
ncbi:glycosyltransferase [uncultured Granulicatella sp.]|uniref:glycosyltransferase n=1 Tax=uncultured Granulicatella sp. TaxID=316089 RepID=UPI0028D7A6EC|nr:glycosyltransferase [uncultured Granulicatella sp.]